MPDFLGINTSGDGQAEPRQLADCGAGWVRCVVRENEHITDWIGRLQARGIETMLIADGSDTSLTKDEANWRPRLEGFKAEYGNIVKLWQVGNEPDGVPDSASWKMDRPTTNHLMRLAREIFPREEGFTLVAPALISGNWLWLIDLQDGNGNEIIDFSPVDILDLHPYNKEPNTEPLERMFREYRTAFEPEDRPDIPDLHAAGKPIWCTEYDSRTAGMGSDLIARAQRFAVMCWDSRMTEDENLKLGIIDDVGRMNNFRQMIGFAAFASQDELNAFALLA
jgi:hypothetical protein